jgi:hypothetical protein
MGSYRDRDRYRNLCDPGELIRTRVTVAETDLEVLTDQEVGDLPLELVLACRGTLEAYLEDAPGFRDALLPLDPLPGAPPLIREMCRAARLAGVGPMAGVAGAVADHVGRGLRRRCATVVVENGGDVFLASPRERVVGIWAGEASPGSRLGIRLPGGSHPTGICTSSAAIGPSFSAGNALAATVVASSAVLADALATSLGNRLRDTASLVPALEWVRGLEGAWGAVAVLEGRLAFCGDLDLVHFTHQGGR